jgi:tRNA A37 threonylcarbamoyladenosine modification protein TsaB
VLAAEERLPGGDFLACMDARMGELYWAVFTPGINSAAEAVGPPAAVMATAGPLAAAAGRGLAACPDIVITLHLPPERVFAEAEPHARDIAWLADRDLATGVGWLDAALAQPVYLRDQVVQLPKNT